MFGNTPPPTSEIEDGLQFEFVRLKHFIEEYFPAEAACIDPSNRTEVLRLAEELLARLWRLEN